MLSKIEVLEMLDKELQFPRSLEHKTIIHVIDYSENPLAPEKYAYKISYVCSVFKDRQYRTFYPFTVGLQGKSKVKGKLLK